VAGQDGNRLKQAEAITEIAPTKANSKPNRSFRIYQGETTKTEIRLFLLRSAAFATVLPARTTFAELFFKIIFNLHPCFPDENFLSMGSGLILPPHLLLHF
jgi:hypothetical protein